MGYLPRGNRGKISKRRKRGRTRREGGVFDEATRGQERKGGQKRKGKERRGGQKRRLGRHSPSHSVGSRGTNCLLTAVHASISIVPGDNNLV